MNATENRKSMDDVLASIRRIVRAEKDPDMAEPGTAEGQPPGAWEDEPLPLTPDMRTDRGAVEPEAIAHPSDAGRGAVAAAAESGIADREMLRDLVREVLLDELERGRGEEMVRDILRDELVNGEVGANISQNVLRLIRSEVEKALAAR